MEEIFDQVKVFFELNPKYAYLVLSIIFLIFAIGNFLNKNWAIDPANSTQKFNYKIFGHTIFRSTKGLLYLLGFIAGLCGFIMHLE